MRASKSGRIKVLAVSFLGLSLMAAAIWAEGDQKAYTISRESTQAVLAVKISTGQTAPWSMTLYGDGRLAMRRHGSDWQVLEETVLELERPEVDALLRIVVDHDLPDYDETDIIARQIRGATDTDFGHAAPYGNIILVEIMLDSYTSRGRTRNDVFTKISINSPKSTAIYYPDIQEFRGIALLEAQLYAYWLRVGGRLW